MTARERTLVWLVVLVGFILALYVLRPILLPFVAAMAVAYFLDPVCDRLEALGLGRGAATGVVTLVFFIVIAGVLSAGMPILFSELAELAQRIPRYVEAVRTKLQPLFDMLAAELQDQSIRDIGQTITQYAGTAFSWVTRGVSEVLGGLGAVANILSLLIITPIIAFYLLRDWDRMIAKLDHWLPRAQADTVRGLVREIDDILAGFARGQATVCIVLGLFYGFGLMLVGLDFGFLVGLFTGLVSFIPYFGMLIGAALGFAIAFAQFDSLTPFLLVAAVYIAGQVMEGNFLTPKLVGGSVKLHEVWIIFALMAGASLFGFVGILLAVPVAATIGVVLRFALRQYLASPLYTHGEILGHLVEEDEPDANGQGAGPRGEGGTGA